MILFNISNINNAQRVSSNGVSETRICQCCIDRNNPFHFTSRKWLIDHQFDIGEN